MAEEEQINELLPHAGEVWSLLEILSIAASPQEVEEWIDRESVGHSEFAPGYLLFLETGVRRFITISENNPDIDLESDYETERALAQLAELSKVPISTEKLVFYRNLNHIQSEIRSIGPPYDTSLYLDEAAEALEFLLSIRENIANEIEQTDPSIDFADASEAATIIELYRCFQDAERGRPWGYGPINLKPWLSSGVREHSIRGYVSTLQYVWSCLLSEQKYLDASIRDLSNVERWNPRDVYQLEDEEYSREPQIYLTGYKLQVKNAIIDPIDNRFEELASPGSLTPHDLLRIPSETSLKSYFDPLLADVETVSPDDLDPQSRVAYGLIWFEQAEWLGSSSFSTIPLIETILFGLVRYYSTFDEDIPMHITRFNHPVEDAGNLVSYAILQRMPQGTLGDPSGWLIFNNIAADFEIEGQAKLEFLEGLISVVSEINEVKLNEITVDRVDFIEAVAPRLTDDYLEVVRSNENLLSAVEDARGIIVELATVYVLSRRVDSGNIQWAQKIHGEEVDVAVEKSDAIRVIECKLDVESAGISKTLGQLQNKIKVFAKDGQDMIGEVWSWRRPSDATIQEIRDSGFEFCCVADSPEVVEASTNDLKNLFEDFLPEVEDRGLLAPTERFRELKPDPYDSEPDSSDIDLI